MKRLLATIKIIGCVWCRVWDEGVVKDEGVVWDEGVVRDVQCARRVWCGVSGRGFVFIACVHIIK